MSDWERCTFGRIAFDAHDPDDKHTTGYWLSVADYNFIANHVERLENLRDRVSDWVVWREKYGILTRSGHEVAVLDAYEKTLNE